MELDYLLLAPSSSKSHSFPFLTQQGLHLLLDCLESNILFRETHVHVGMKKKRKWATEGKVVVVPGAGEGVPCRGRGRGKGGSGANFLFLKLEGGHLGVCFNILCAIL